MFFRVQILGVCRCVVAGTALWGSSLLGNLNLELRGQFCLTTSLATTSIAQPVCCPHSYKIHGSSMSVRGGNGVRAGGDGVRVGKELILVKLCTNCGLQPTLFMQVC